MRSRGGHGRPARCGGPAGARPACPSCAGEGPGDRRPGPDPDLGLGGRRPARCGVPGAGDPAGAQRPPEPTSRSRRGIRRPAIAARIVVERTFYREPSMPCRDYMRTVETTGSGTSGDQGHGLPHRRRNVGARRAARHHGRYFDRGPRPRRPRACRRRRAPEPVAPSRLSRPPWPRPVRPARTRCSCRCRARGRPSSLTPCRPEQRFEGRRARTPC